MHIGATRRIPVNRPCAAADFLSDYFDHLFCVSLRCSFLPRLISMQCRGTAASASGGDERPADRATLHYRAETWSACDDLTQDQCVYVHRVYSLCMSHYCLEATTTHSNRRVRLGRRVASHCNLKTSVPISGASSTQSELQLSTIFCGPMQPAS